MIIRVQSTTYLRVADDAQAEAACGAFEEALPAILKESGFPHGEAMRVNIEKWENVSADESQEQGLTE